MDILKSGRKMRGEDLLSGHTSLHVPVPTIEKPLADITLADLLQCSPEVQSKKGSEHRSSIFDTFRGKSSSASESSSTSRKTSTSTLSNLNLESSKLATLDTPGYAQPFEKMGKRKLKKLKKDEREKTKGSAWFNMPFAEMTQERKNDLEALSLRGALDKKRFYKRNNLPVRPKYFQVGRIIETPADYYHSRVPKKQRKQTMAEEMVAEISSTVSHL